jgi:hypothetical protein
VIKKIGLALDIIVVLAVCGLVFTKCHKQEQVLTTPVLKENEKQKVIVDTRRKTVSVVRRIGTPKNPGAVVPQVERTTRGVRKVVVTETNDGEITVTAITKGFVCEPGLALYYSDRARLGLDVQIAYWHSYGLVLGAGVNLGEEPRNIRAHVAVSRTLPLNLFSNTSVFVGVDNKKDVVGGLRIQF